MFEPLVYTIQEAANVSKRCRATIYNELRAGRLKAKKHGDSTLILAEDLKIWLDSLPEYKSAVK